MASQSQGVQQLLAAEKKAAEKVSEARKSKLYFGTNLVFQKNQIRLDLNLGNKSYFIHDKLIMQFLIYFEEIIFLLYIS